MGLQQEQWRKNQQLCTKFSIIIPMKNAEKYITNAFESIRQQDYNNCEVLIINDHSEDASLEKVRELQKENAEMNTKIFNVEDGTWGPGVGRNIGLDHATGEYIVFLDADDELLPNALKNINSAIKDNDKTKIFILGQLSHLLSKKDRKTERQRRYITVRS